MSAEKLNWPEKSFVRQLPEIPLEKKLTDIELNELSTKFNSHADEIDVLGAKAAQAELDIEALGTEGVNIDVAYKYPWKNTLTRTPAVDAILDIKEVKLYINHPSAVVIDGRYIQLYLANIRHGDGGFIYVKAIYPDGSDVLVMNNNAVAEQTGVQTVTLSERDENGLKLELTLDFDLIAADTTFSPGASFAFHENIVRDAVSDYIKLKSQDLPFSDINRSKLPALFKEHFYSGEDTEVALFGDSIITSLISGSEIPDAEAMFLPPSCHYKYLPYYLWKNATFNKAKYDRFDSTDNQFTEGGLWIDGEPFTNANTWKRGGALTRYTTTSEASVAFDWDLSEYEKLNFIFSKESSIANQLTITISDGDGVVLVYDVGTESWIEANGYQFSQSCPALNTSSGQLGWVANTKLRFKRVTSSGSSTITIEKGDNADRIHYWGTERFNGQGLFFNNCAFYANRTSMLNERYVSELFNEHRNVNLIIYELTMLNEIHSTPEVAVNGIHDLVWGDRAGNANPNSIKALTNDFADCQVLFIIPHFAHSFYSESTDQVDVESQLAYQLVKKLISEKSETGYIDFQSILAAQARQRGISMFEATKGYSVNPENIYTYMRDGIHMNNQGAELFSKYLAPMFW